MLGLHVIQYPTGTFGFVGRVPAVLAFDSAHVGDMETARQHGPGLARKIAEREGRSFVTRTFSTKADAIAFASDHGFTAT